MNVSKENFISHMNQPIVVVLGMHRSGTSVVTRALQAVGVSLGDRLMPAVSGNNDKGFFEDIDIFNLNERLLSAVGHAWHSISLLKGSDVDFLFEQGYQKEAIQLLRKKSLPGKIFGFKDPRTAKLLPFWLRVFQIGNFEARYVIAIRNPISVVDSLAKRDGLAPERSYLLWTSHILTIFSETSEDSRVLVDYDQLVAKPKKTIARLAEFLNTNVDIADQVVFSHDFLSEELRHSFYLPQDVWSDSAALELAKEIYTAISDVAMNGEAIKSFDNLSQIGRWETEFSRIKPLLGLIDRLGSCLSERDRQIASLSQVLSERDGQIASLTDETVRRGEWALRLDAELKEVRAKVSAMAMSNSWRITLPLREVRRWISSPNAQAKRYTIEALRFAKRTYQSLPLSARTKARHRQWIAKVAPRVLLASGAHSSTIPGMCISQPFADKATIKAGRPAIEYQNVHTAGISIVASDNPLVSVIIPIHGKVDYTLRCLATVAAHTTLAEFEVIVVDDCSPDDSWSVLSQKVKGIRLLRNEHNQGFIRSCNIGAKAAKGQYLYFLNNDTEVTEGWLDALLRTFSDFPGTGLAGSKLVYPDGRLQEAGGIIWQDGSAWNFGRFQDPQLPVYNYAREVDYCSGASIMVPKSLFEDLGGFDEHYLPAYCEDSDLALKIRDKGYRVIYQPLSTVIHYEGITSGTDITQGTKAYQVENTKKMFVRWQQRLRTHQASGCDVDNAKDRRAVHRVLFLDHCTPTPNQDSGSIDAYNQMLLMREMDYQVTFIPEDNFLFMPYYTAELQSRGIEMLYAPYVIGVEQHLKNHGDRYDLVFLSRPTVFDRNIHLIRKYCRKAKVLFHTVDLHFLRMQREADLLGSNSLKQKAAEMKEHELSHIKAADVSTVLSVDELTIVQRLVPDAKVKLLPYSRTIRGTKSFFSDRENIIFVGGYQHTPNIDAVKYFVKDVMPLLRKKLPGVLFYAIGSNPSADIQALASEDIIITGFVEDLNPLLDKMRVSVAPLRYGAGIKGKIGTAMAVGLPVVATSLASEGMSLTDGENILLADGSEAFANAVAKIYQDEALWSSLSQNGLAFADTAWGAEAAWSTLTAILKDLGVEGKRGLHPLSLYSESVAEPKKHLE